MDTLPPGRIALAHRFRHSSSHCGDNATSRFISAHIDDEERVRAILDISVPHDKAKRVAARTRSVQHFRLEFPARGAVRRHGELAASTGEKSAAVELKDERLIDLHGIVRYDRHSYALAGLRRNQERLDANSLRVPVAAIAAARADAVSGAGGLFRPAYAA